MAVARRDFRYYDHERKESVQVREGDKVDHLAPFCDMTKLDRTKFVDLGAEGSERPREPVKRKKRGS